MGERKVLNFYVSPDFDASIIPRQKRDRTKLIEVRTMLPFSMRCNTCGEYMYRGKKFNSRKEDMPGENYMGIRRFRFYIKCSVCSAEITFCTDPKNSDYELESGEEYIYIYCCYFDYCMLIWMCMYIKYACVCMHVGCV